VKEGGAGRLGYRRGNVKIINAPNHR